MKLLLHKQQSTYFQQKDVNQTNWLLVLKAIATQLGQKMYGGWEEVQIIDGAKKM